MRISAKCDYACRALLELSLHWPQKVPLQIQQISQKQDIPMKYLVQILIHLKREGLVSSSRGKEGGYLLAKTPSQINLGRVIRAMSGELLPVSKSDPDQTFVFNGLWKEVEAAIAQVVDNITFEDVCQRSIIKNHGAMYQI